MLENIPYFSKLLIAGRLKDLYGSAVVREARTTVKG